MSESSYYYFKSRGQVLGPFELRQIQQRAKRAQINSRSEISTDGFSWHPAQHFPEIFAANVAAPPAAVVSGGEEMDEPQDWYYSRGGDQQGPVAASVLHQMIGTGELSLNDQVWKDGMSDWRPAGQVPELSAQVQPGSSGHPQAGGAGPIGGGFTAFCTSCGQQIPREAEICVHCGVPNRARASVPGAMASGGAVGASGLSGETQWYQWFLNAVTKKYADFTGRARRKEYWFYQLGGWLFYFGGAIVAGAIEGVLSEGEGLGEYGEFVLPGAFVALFCLGVLVPSFAVMVRRLHDTGKSGWFALISLIPIGNIILLVWLCQDSEAGGNQYGPNPKLY